ncbi:MAG TPA: hypothetical protein VFR97_11350 [Capillimicrobium sp.]|nr:hypothetical protein [Capillimicrobium sp.]
MRLPSPSSLLPAAVAVAVLAVSAGPAAAAPVTGASLWFNDAVRDEFTAGKAMLVFRTEAALPTSTGGSIPTRVRIGGQRAYLYTISSELHCYGADVDVLRGRKEVGRAGDRLKVTIGRAGGLLRRSLEVQPYAADVARGANLGCDADPKSTTVLFDLFYQPEIEPERVFFTANAGPYLKDLAWTGWGTAQAIGTGTYVSDCASCGPKQILPARLVLERPGACRGWGVQVYLRSRLEKTLESGEVTTTELGPGDAPCG